LNKRQKKIPDSAILFEWKKSLFLELLPTTCPFSQAKLM